MNKIFSKGGIYLTSTDQDGNEITETTSITAISIYNNETLSDKPYSYEINGREVTIEEYYNRQQTIASYKSTMDFELTTKRAENIAWVLTMTDDFWRFLDEKGIEIKNDTKFSKVYSDFEKEVREETMIFKKLCKKEFKLKKRILQGYTN